MMKEFFEYLAKYQIDRYGTSWVLVNQVVEDMRISRDDLWKIIRENKKEALLDHISTNVPCAEGLLSVTITQRGRRARHGPVSAAIRAGILAYRAKHGDEKAAERARKIQH